jgi:hypothetical protein
MSHTKGPWKLDETWMLIMADNGVEVAACHAGRGADAKANARLIAAAPELLSLLKSCKVLMDGLPYMGPEELKLLEDVIKLVDKAEGKE